MLTTEVVFVACGSRRHLLSDHIHPLYYSIERPSYIAYSCKFWEGWTQAQRDTSTHNTPIPHLIEYKFVITLVPSAYP